VADEAKAQAKVDTGTERFLVAAALYTALVALVLGHQLGSNGLLADATSLWRELHWTAERPWGMGLEEPFCYRPLFRALVLGVCSIVGDDPSVTYGVFLVLSALSLLLAAGCFDLLLGRLGFSSHQRLAGVALFLLGFPVLFSHDIPIQTREDLLGYALIAATLVAVADDRPIVAGLLAAVGATVRETCLLGVLPLVLVSRRRWPELAPAYLLPFLCLCLVRFAQAPAGPRVSLVELVVNSTKPARERPGEALLYAFAAFGALWVAAGLRLAASISDSRAAPRHPLLAPRVVAAALGSVVLFGWLMGMIRENRITYVLFPFVVPLALDWLWTHGAALRRPPAMATGLVVLLAGALGIAWLRDDYDRVMGLWPVIGDCFNPGIPSVLEVPIEGTDETELRSIYFASPLQGPVVVVHLALAAAIAVAAGLERWRPRQDVAPGVTLAP
jgi:hypothetical protein